MFSIRKINPMVRAVGTMGAVAAIAGGITFATATSNTVALSPNTLVSATAHLQIGVSNGANCVDATDGPQTGMNYTLAPGVASPTFDFCLKNTGNVPLDITTGIVQADFNGSAIPPSDVTLSMTCPGDSATANGTLDQYTGGTSFGTIGSGDEVDCQATATLSNSYSGQGGQAVNPFEIDFVGTQSTT